MKTKTFFRYAIFITFSFIIGYFIFKAKSNSEHFVKNKINSKIIRIYNYENKTLEFYYDEKYCITTTDTKGDTLIIGDSINKEKNTSKFKIFRKNKFGNYEYFDEYQISGL
ncbi:hypothetical protein [Flavobacterium sp. S87F.05.LMB.W.Kidney.N]|uniref:hypothetical protein n=1 Tax=Flavobacterium sp. S87F.05.LMB.W.Kidney.N TaxID=1278758 RepID=UPI0010655C5E|nr:hypothetical protein [Flavobacterium sp. S87F.05.LMB.W.Kidney.N]TDX13997.1 hypothetical protein EDB96_0714 [Flavobacterium sp. S87F.05.LMB.W.Kidney.N]